MEVSDEWKRQESRIKDRYSLRLMAIEHLWMLLREVVDDQSESTQLVLEAENGLRLLAEFAKGSRVRAMLELIRVGGEGVE